MKCGARSTKDTWDVHICGLKKGHKGRHRCGQQVDMTRGKVLTKAIPCNRKWGKP